MALVSIDLVLIFSISPFLLVISIHADDERSQVSWGAWPQAGQHQMNTGEDVAYKSALQNKKYMMGVSPHFYTSKNPLLSASLQ